MAHVVLSGVLRVVLRLRIAEQLIFALMGPQPTSLLLVSITPSCISMSS